MFLRGVRLKRDEVEDWSAYPYCLPSIQALGELMFTSPTTFFLGENGSGKSTLLEATAVACGFNAEGGSRNFRFSTAETHSPLHRALTVIRAPKRERDGYFLRAESFYNVASHIDRLDNEFSFGPPLRDSYGGKSLHEQSHGEAFFSLFMHRIEGPGLYLLDEPEAALSPTRQLALLRRMHELALKGSQFIIASHSPILLSYPGAQLWQLGEGAPYETEYERTEHYAVMRNFVNNYRAMQRTLFEDDT